MKDALTHTLTHTHTLIHTHTHTQTHIQTHFDCLNNIDFKINIVEAINEDFVPTTIWLEIKDMETFQEII